MEIRIKQDSIDELVVGKSDICQHYCYQVNRQGCCLESCQFYRRTLDKDHCDDPIKTRSSGA